MEKIIKKISISELKEGDIVDDVFVVKIKKGFIPYTNGYAFELILSDNSGKSLTCKYWGPKDEKKVRDIYDSIKADSVVRVKGRVTTYKGKLELTANEPDSIEVIDKSRYEETAFVKISKKDIEKVYAKIMAEIEQLENEKIKKHPAAIEIHHNWIGGLLEHTLEVVEICKKVHELYPNMEKDLLVAGALLHDIGKLEEIEVTSRIKGTTKGQLLGHLVLGANIVAKKCDEVMLDEMTKNKLLHIIISHHGKLEYGSPKEPMFPEALAVYYADELSSKIAELCDFVEGAKHDTNDNFMFHDRIKRNILLR
ncbi:MAG: HD domain-containing protein [Candidatus Diapherotrites archaeon]